MPRKRGVYFIANDNIVELAIAFLNSFRIYNPTIPLCLIPFDDNFQQLAPLQSHYNFSIWNDSGILRQCDDIGLSFHDRPKGHFRKLATWEGGYDEFLYIDSDTVVLRSIDFVFDYLGEVSFLVATSNIPGRAWKKSIHQAGRLTPQQIAFAANTGFVASKKGCLALHDVVNQLPAAIELAPHMKLGYEQPFLNYLMVTSGMLYTSLREIRKTTGDPNIPGELYAQDGHAVAQDGYVVSPEYPPTLLVHWTEPVKPTQPDKQSIPLYELWKFYRHMSLDLYQK